MPHRRPARRLRIESLEYRLAPALFTGAVPNLSIDLNTANEVAAFSTDGTTVTVTLTGGTATDGGGTVGFAGFGTSTVTFPAATYNSLITITDSAAGTSVAFANSTGAYDPVINITLDDPASGNITFTGVSVFTSAVTASTTAGFIASDVASSLLSSAGGGVTLSAPGHDILLAGALEINGQTNLTGNVIRADNPVNDFIGRLSLSGPAVASIFDTNDLTLAASILNFGTLAQTTTITANGNITQTGALTATAGAGTTATLAVTSNAGSITLTDAGNNISNSIALSLSVTGANTATVVNTVGLQLGDVALGTGALSLTFNGNLTQRTGTTIQTDGPVSLTVDTGANRNITLANAGNRIAGPITIAEINGGDVRDVSIRNA
ncbi:MAG TPA: hypothetical protein VKE40_27300, partial [Gemmataceae bacterium]|nr:hypothetical protein [Gemmataceae bacterium]